MTETTIPTKSPPSQTQTPTPASTSTLNVDPTASLSELPFPALPDFPRSAGDYRLATPAPDQLLALMAAARRQTLLMDEIGGLADRWEWLSRGVLQETDAFVDAVEGTFLLAYPKALPDAAIVFQDPYATWWTAYPDQHPYPPRYVVDGFLAQLNQDGQKLVAEGSIDISSFSIDTYPAELDGTPGQEWIFSLWTPAMDARYNGLALWQAVDELTGPKYVPMGDPVIAQPYLWPNLYEVADLTGDGLTDLITIGSGAGAGSVRKDFIAYQWTPAGFKQMSHIIHWADMGAEEFATEPYVKFFPETPPALRLVSDTHLAWGCVYKTVEVYRWTGGVEQRAESSTLNPDAPNCLLARATQIYTSDRMDFDTTQSLLERALTGFDPHDPKDQPKIAFARYHLAILEAIRGNDTAARLHLRNVIQGFLNDAPTTKYLDKNLVPLLADPQLKATDLCSLSNSAPEDVFSTWRSGLKRPFGAVTTEDICSPYDIANRVMQQLPIGSPDSPEPQINAAGLDARSAQSLQFPGLKEPIWLAIINETSDESNLIVSIPLAPDNTEKGIEWIQLEQFYDTSGQPVWLNADITGDGAVEVALAFPSREERDCKVGEDGYEVFIAGRVATQANVYASSSINACQRTGQPIDLRALLADRDGDNLSDRLIQELENQRREMGVLALPGWTDQKPTWYTQDDLYTYFRALAEQENDLLTSLHHNGEPAQTRARLLALRQALHPALPGRNPRQQIDYLIALSYELEGQTDEAVKRYLELARETPQTFWSNLAAVKIVRR